MAFRTSNRQSLQFKVRRGMRRMKERALAALIAQIDGSTRAAA